MLARDPGVVALGTRPAWPTAADGDKFGHANILAARVSAAAARWRPDATVPPGTLRSLIPARCSWFLTSYELDAQILQMSRLVVSQLDGLKRTSASHARTRASPYPVR